MCFKNNSDSPAWHIIHFLLIGLSAFTHHQRLFIGGQVFVTEAVTGIFLLIPILFIELKLGGMVQKSVYGLFHAYFPLLRGVAVVLLVQMFILGTYWAALPTYYICAGFASVSSQREVISKCNNKWNTANCREVNSQSPAYDYSNETMYAVSRSSPVEEYMAHQFFGWSGVLLDNLGGFSYGLGFPAFPIALVITWMFIFLTVAFGPRIFAWIISILGVITIIIFVGVLGYGWNVVAQTGDGGAMTALLYYYLPDFSELGNLNSWQESIIGLGFVIPLWLGLLPTYGKLTGSGKILRNITWLFALFIAAIFRHIQVLTIAPYQYAAAVRANRPMGDYLSRIIEVRSALETFVTSRSHPSATFFFFFAQYINIICCIALIVLVLVDNILEAFDWLLKDQSCNRRVVWFVTTTILSVAMMLLGLPFTTRDGYDFLGMVDHALIALSCVGFYFFGLGLLVIYLWQNVASAQRIVIGIWAFLACVVWVVMGMLQLAQIPLGIYLASGSRIYSQKWTSIWWLIAAGPYVFIVLGVLVYVIQLLIRKRHSGGLILAKVSEEESATLTEKRKADGTTNVEDVQLVSSF